MAAHDVYIIHAGEDRPVAEAAAAALEAKGISCWNTEHPFTGRTTASDAALLNSRVVIFVFSAKANDSTEATQQVAMAFDTDVTVIPLRIENVFPADLLEYYLSAVHWLDAATPPLEPHLDRLVQAVRALLAQG